MKKIIALLLIALMVVVMAGCESELGIAEDSGGAKDNGPMEIQGGNEAPDSPVSDTDIDNNTAEGLEPEDALDEKDNSISSDNESSDSVASDMPLLLEEETNTVVNPLPESRTKEVNLYFANLEYVITGNEKLEKLIPEKREVRYGDVPLVEAVVRELMRGTKNPDLDSSIPSTVKLLDVQLANSIAYVNFAKDGLYGGSLQEILTINQVVHSLLELEGVNKVQFLIDGKKAESLMGHITILEPFDGLF